jgi:hypothetical protein
MVLPFFTIFVIFVILLAIRYKSLNNRQDDMQASFWEREAAANAVPPVDLDALTYITVPLERFPLGNFTDANIVEMENKLQQLSTQRMLNITGKTNTELKETYGVPNLTKVQSYGENFDQLTVVIKEYGEALLHKECISDAVTVLEYGVAVKTDVSQNYILLGQCYKTLGQTDKISYLMEQVSSMSLVLGPSILRHLQALLDEENASAGETAEEDFSL